MLLGSRSTGAAGPLWGHGVTGYTASPLGIRGREVRGRRCAGRKIDLVDCQKYLATYAYLGREKEEFTRITRVLNAHLGLNGPCLRDVYLGSSIKHFPTVYRRGSLVK